MENPFALALELLDLFVIALELGADGVLHRVDRLGGECLVVDEGLFEERRRRLFRADGAVELGRGEGGLVGLVVPVAAVADDVDDDVAVEALAELEGEPGAVEDVERAVAVDVEDRSLDHLDDVSAVD